LTTKCGRKNRRFLNIGFADLPKERANLSRTANKKTKEILTALYVKTRPSRGCHSMFISQIFISISLKRDSSASPQIN